MSRILCNYHTPQTIRGFGPCRLFCGLVFFVWVWGFVGVCGCGCGGVYWSWVQRSVIGATWEARQFAVIAHSVHHYEDSHYQLKGIIEVRLTKTLFTILVAVTLMILTQAKGVACTCLVSSPSQPLRRQVTQARNDSRALFSGKVLEIAEDPQTSSLTVKLKVERVWKGSIPAEVVIETGRGGGDCGYGFEVGERYLVYVSGSNELKMQTNICQRTARLSEAASDLKILGRGKGVPKRKLR